MFTIVFSLHSCFLLFFVLFCHCETVFKSCNPKLKELDEQRPFIIPYSSSNRKLNVSKNL